MVFFRGRTGGDAKSHPGYCGPNPENQLFSKTENPGKLGPSVATAELSYAEYPTLLQLKTQAGYSSTASSVPHVLGGPKILVKTGK